MENQRDVDLTPGTGLSDVSDTGTTGGTSGLGAGGFDSTRSTSTGTGYTGSGSLGGTSYETDSLGSSPSDTGTDVRSRARHLVDNVRSTATEKAEERISEQKYRAADSLGNVAQSLRTASQQLPDDGGMSRYMAQAANQVDNLASFLNNRDVAELFDEVESLARRQPAVFVGGAFALGVLGARFLRSSRRNLSDHDRWSSHQLESRMVDPGLDAVSRPGAPGYAPPAVRGDTGMGGGAGYGTSTGYGTGTGAGSSGYGGGTGGTGYGTGSTGLGTGTGMGGTGTGGAGTGGTGLGGASGGTGSSGFGASGAGSNLGRGTGQSGTTGGGLEGDGGI